MEINKIPFAMTKSRDIDSGMAQLINNKTIRPIMTLTLQVVQAYQARGFRVCNTLVDGGFESTRELLAEMGITLKVA